MLFLDIKPYDVHDNLMKDLSILKLITEYKFLEYLDIAIPSDDNYKNFMYIYTITDTGSFVPLDSVNRGPILPYTISICKDMFMHWFQD